MKFKNLKEFEKEVDEVRVDVLREEAIQICKAIKEAENRQLELDGYIFTEEYARLLKWLFNITEEELE